MNNMTFGDGESGYYETVAGGAGAVSCIWLEIYFLKFKFWTAARNMSHYFAIYHVLTSMTEVPIINKPVYLFAEFNTAIKGLIKASFVSYF